MGEPHGLFKRIVPHSDAVRAPLHNFPPEGPQGPPPMLRKLWRGGHLSHVVKRAPTTFLSSLPSSVRTRISGLVSEEQLRGNLSARAGHAALYGNAGVGLLRPSMASSVDVAHEEQMIAEERGGLCTRRSCKNARE